MLFVEHMTFVGDVEMGITFGAIERMEALGLFGASQTRILDIGSSNLYSATPENIECFLSRHSPAQIADAKDFSERLARGSGYDPVRGGLNESFVGELFEKAGMEYLSFDIADGYRTKILDLNHDTLPGEAQGYFDLVLNFGTTEHILNQYNCFKVIHDATKVGGYMYHQLPSIGFVNHGYLTYTCKSFFEIAGFNDYEIVDFHFGGPSGTNDILSGLRSYSGYFPTLKQTLDELQNSPSGAELLALTIPDVSIDIVCRKVKDKPFWGALESSTSVGSIPSEVTASYSTSKFSQMLRTQQRPRPFVSKITGMLHGHPRLFEIARYVYRAFR